MMLATIAAKTSVVRHCHRNPGAADARAGCCWPSRSPLDHISGGQVTLAVAAGGYRDEFSVVPDLADASRVDLMAEGIESLRVLFEQPRSTYEGKYRRFVDVESYRSRCRTVADLLRRQRRRVRCSGQGERCEGWLPAKIGPADIAAGRAKVARYAEGCEP